jgi:isoleucyl-tRNA synthetase
MSLARRVVTLGLAARNEAGQRVRQPLRRALVLLPAGEALPDEVAALVADELNVKQLERVHDPEGILDYAVTPNFRRLGPRLGPRLPAVKAALATADGAALRRALAADGRVTLDVDGEAVALDPEDVAVRARAHGELVLAEDAGLAVALDVTLDDELRSEGLARELVRTLNEHRKTIGLELADRVRVELRADGAVADAAARHGSWISDEILATEWHVDGLDADGVDAFAALEVDGAPVRVRLEKS